MIFEFSHSEHIFDFITCLKVLPDQLHLLKAGLIQVVRLALLLASHFVKDPCVDHFGLRLALIDHSIHGNRPLIIRLVHQECLACRPILALDIAVDFPVPHLEAPEILH